MKVQNTPVQSTVFALSYKEQIRYQPKNYLYKRGNVMYGNETY